MRRAALILTILALGFEANANVVGSDFQNFNPTSNGLDFVTVHSSETLAPGIVNLGLFYNGAKNTLPYFNIGREGYDDFVGYVDFNVGLGLLENWDIGLNIPNSVQQDINVDDDTDIGYFKETGVTEYRFNSKYRFWGDKDKGIALVGSLILNQIKNNPYKGDSNEPDYVIELATDYTFGIVAVGVNFGYKVRNPGEATDDDIDPYDDAYIGSAALSFLIPGSDTKFIFEYFGSIPTEEADTSVDRAQAASEFIAGLKHDFTGNLAAHLGGGSELDNATGSPDWRVYAGLNYAFGPLWGGESEVKEVPKEEVVVRYEEIEEPDVPDEVYIVGNVNFKFASFKKVNPGALSAIDELMDKVVGTEFEKIVISGHTDSVGSDKYNQKLSENRAKQVVKYLLVKYKIPRSKIDWVVR